MTKGLITRIGEWMDRKWQPKATEAQLEGLEKAVSLRFQALEVYSKSKDVEDLKTRLEKLELYTGMSRKVDVAKPVVAKSAFAM